MTKDYLAATRGMDMVKPAYMGVDVSPKQQHAEAEHVISLSRNPRHPTTAAVISGRPASEDFRKHILTYKGTPYIKEVRQVLQVPGTPPGHCLGPVFVRSVRLLGELNMSFDLCMRPAELGDGAKLAGLCPDTRLILDYCGNADPKAFIKAPAEKPWHERESWKRDLAALARRPNVVCKISGIVVRAPNPRWTPDHLAPIVNHCLDEFGPDRVVFGSDWPVCTLTASLGDWVRALKVILRSRPVEMQRKLFHDNAQRLYGLKA